MKNQLLYLVDDDPISLLITGRMIRTFIPEENLPEILSFDKPINALNALEKVLKSSNPQSGPCCWILLDINMPRINGWDFLERLEVIDPTRRCLVAMLTSSISDIDREKSLQYDRVKAFYSKPLTGALVSNFAELVDHSLVPNT